MQFIIGCAFFCAPLLGQAVELQLESNVALTVHGEMNGLDYYAKALPGMSWGMDGTLTVWYLGNSTGSAFVVERGAQVWVTGRQLSLCYAMQPRKFGPDDPIPAIVVPVVLEFRIKGLARGDYVLQGVSVCNWSLTQ